MHFGSMKKKEKLKFLVSLIDRKQAGYEIHHMELIPPPDAFVEKGRLLKLCQNFGYGIQIFLSNVSPSEQQSFAFIDAFNPNQLRDCGRNRQRDFLCSEATCTTIASRLFLLLSSLLTKHVFVKIRGVHDGASRCVV